MKIGLSVIWKSRDIKSLLLGHTEVAYWLVFFSRVFYPITHVFFYYIRQLLVMLMYTDRRHMTMTTGGDLFSVIYLIKLCYTVKPVIKCHPGERQNMVFIDKWSLFGGHFV